MKNKNLFDLRVGHYHKNVITFIIFGPVDVYDAEKMDNRDARFALG